MLQSNSGCVYVCIMCMLERVCVFVCARVCVCARVRARVCVCVCLCARACVCLCVPVYLCVYVNEFICDNTDLFFPGCHDDIFLFLIR